MDNVFNDITSRLKRQGLDQALNHVNQAKSALERREWESANGQVRTFLESLFDKIAALRLKTKKTGGAARKELEDSGLLKPREARLVQEVMAVAGGSGSHPGISNEDEAKGRFLAGIGIAYIGLALIPELVRVEDLIGMLDFGVMQAPTDAELYTKCPSCGEQQYLNEAEVLREGEDTIYRCKHGCQPIVVVSSPESKSWPGRGYRIGDYVIRNAQDLYIPIPGSDRKMVLTACSAALMKNRP